MVNLSFPRLRPLLLVLFIGAFFVPFSRNWPYRRNSDLIKPARRFDLPDPPNAPGAFTKRLAPAGDV